jgi:hypothetical protein
MTAIPKISGHSDTPDPSIRTILNSLGTYNVDGSPKPLA